MSGFVDSEWTDNVERITDDNTIGLARPPIEAGDEDMLVDVSRLRAALVEFDEEIGETTAALTVLQNDDSDLELLTLQDVDATTTIVLAGRVRPEETEDGDQ